MTKQNKVEFLIVGTQKGGTTALCKYLHEHNDICMATRKEVHFFDTNNYSSSQASYAEYHSYFEPKSENQILGEATPIYMYWYDAPRRIWEYNPNMKLIITLRNPIERAYSHWNMERTRDKEKLSFWEAIQNENHRCKQALPLQHRIYSYTDRGFYSEQLKRIWHFFPKEQTLIIRNEDLKDKPYETLKKVFNFLNVSIPSNIIIKSSNSGRYLSPLSFKEFKYLKNTFSLEIQTLEKMLKWDCSKWLEYSNKQNIHFLHIRKTGGSALKYALRSSLLTDKFDITLHKHPTTLKDIPKNEKIIFYIRNPISRFISGFYSRQRQGKPRYFYPWDNEEKIAFEFFSTPNKLALALSSKNLEEKYKAEKAMKNINHIKSSYWDWFGDEKYFKSRLSDIFFIGSQEKFLHDFELLKKKLNLPNHIQLPTDDINMHKTPHSVDKFLEKEAIDNLKVWYKNEFKFINLCASINR